MKNHTVKTLTTEVHGGDLGGEIEATDEQVDAYVEQLREALQAEYPDAEVDITLRRHTSGGSSNTRISGEPDEDGIPLLSDEDDALYDIGELSLHVWAEWLQGMNEEAREA